MPPPEPPVTVRGATGPISSTAPASAPAEPASIPGGSLPGDGPADDGAGRSVLALLMIAIFGCATAVTMLGPLLVDLSRDLGVSLGEAGLLAAAMAVSWAAVAPFAGAFSDRVGRRPSIVFALAGLGLVTLGSGLAPSYGILLACRVLAGVFGGFGPAAIMAAAGDLFPPRRRGMAMSWVNMGFSMSAIAGVPAIGAIGGLFGWRWAFASAGLLLLVLALLIRIAFPAGRPVAAPSGVLSTYRIVFGVAGLPSILGANLLERGVFQLSVLYLPSFLILSYGLDATTVAPVLVLVAVGNIAGNVAGGWIGDRLPRAAIFVVAQLLAGGIGVALFTLPVGLASSALGAALFGLVNASSRPALLALGTELSARHRGAVLGLISLTNQGGVILGSSVGGLALGLGGYVAVGLLILGGGILAPLLALPLLRRGAARPA